MVVTFLAKKNSCLYNNKACLWWPGDRSGHHRESRKVMGYCNAAGTFIWVWLQALAATFRFWTWG
jgi:hypothetical protein